MKKLLLSLLGIFIVTVVIATLSINAVVKRQIIKVVESVVGSEVTIENINVSPFAGIIKLNNFAIKNPEGFRNKNIFEFSEVLITIDNIKKIKGYWAFNLPQVIVANPKIYNEVSVTGNNIAMIKKRLAEGVDKEAYDTDTNSPVNPEVFAEKPKVLVSIQSFEVVNSEVELSQNIVGETSSKVIVPKINVGNIGLYDEPLLVDIAFRNVLEKFLNSIVRESNKSITEERVESIIGGAIQESLDKMGIKNDEPVTENPTEESTETNPSEANSPVKASE
jgi:hypothetical protein